MVPTPQSLNREGLIVNWLPEGIGNILAAIFITLFFCGGGAVVFTLVVDWFDNDLPAIREWWHNRGPREW